MVLILPFVTGYAKTCTLTFLMLKIKNVKMDPNAIKFWDLRDSPKFIRIPWHQHQGNSTRTQLGKPSVWCPHSSISTLMTTIYYLKSKKNIDMSNMSMLNP